jgi:acetyl-CoA acetyltransferase
VAVPADGSADAAGETSALVTADQGMRRGSSTETLAALRPAFTQDG